jgi:hypothetical protein
VMPGNPAGCVKIGGGLWPWYWEGWFCPTSTCSKGFCAGSTLGSPGRCGASAADIHAIVSSGEGKVLAGTLPPLTGSFVPNKEKVFARAPRVRAHALRSFFMTQQARFRHIATFGAAPAWVVTRAATSCAGCTTGGLACFGQNACGVDCIVEEARDCCGNLMTATACCPSCTKAGCKPNQPCLLGGKEPNKILSDTCPPNPSVPAGCQYYSRRDLCTSAKCKYYNIESPKQCESPPPTVSAVASAAELHCIRQCLQIADSALSSGDRNANGCPKPQPIISYHRACFTSCGISAEWFPENLFLLLGDYDE